MRKLLLMIVAVLVVSTACGVIADDNAAVVDGQGVPTATVDAMARDSAFSQLLGYQSAESDSVLPGNTARTALGFAVQAETAVLVAKRWGLTVEPDEAGLAQQLQGAPVSVDDLSPEARRVTATYLGAMGALAARFKELQKPTGSDLKLLYRGAPLLWERVCLEALTAPVESSDDVSAALEHGTALLDVPRSVTVARAAADPKQGCLTVNDLPPELRRAVDRAQPRRVVGPVEISSQGQSVLVWFKVRSRSTTSFTKARRDLTQLAAQLAKQGPATWLALVSASFTEVNPRYGTGMDLVPDGQGSVRAEVGKPASPVGATSTVPALGAAGTSGSGGPRSGATGSGTQNSAP